MFSRKSRWKKWPSKPANCTDAAANITQPWMRRIQFLPSLSDSEKGSLLPRPLSNSLNEPTKRQTFHPAGTVNFLSSNIQPFSHQRGSGRGNPRAPFAPITNRRYCRTSSTHGFQSPTTTVVQTLGSASSLDEELVGSGGIGESTVTSPYSKKKRKSSHHTEDRSQTPRRISGFPPLPHFPSPPLVNRSPSRRCRVSAAVGTCKRRNTNFLRPPPPRPPRPPAPHRDSLFPSMRVEQKRGGRR